MHARRRRLLQGFVQAGAAAVAAPAILRPGPARAAEVTLRMHHFLPAMSNSQTYFLKPWAERVEQASGGRIAIQIFPSMQLGGAPPQLYDQARDGVVDIVWALPGYTPGRFPKIEVFELPFVPARRGLVNSKAVQTLVGSELADEFQDVHLICAWAHDHGLIHAKRQVSRLEDLQGLKLRFPTRLAGEALRALGASAIGMPVPQVPESLAQGVIDGCVVPWEVVPSLKIEQLVNYHTDIPGTPTLYTATFVLVMNRARFASMPGDLREALDANSGIAAAEMAGQAWDDASAAALALVQKRKNVITTLSEEEKARWQQATAPVVEAWLAAMKGKNIDGAGLLEQARALIAEFDRA